MGSSLFLRMYNSIVSVLYLSFSCFDSVSLLETKACAFARTGCSFHCSTREASLAVRGVLSFQKMVGQFVSGSWALLPCIFSGHHIRL